MPFHDIFIRTCDVFLTVLALIFLSPWFAVIAILISLDSPGTILFKQERVGKDGTIFKIFKFRTMKPSQSKIIPQYRKSSTGKIEPILKMRNDKRVTRFGYFLRKYSLDELPQFINIIRGEMSLVGPRPPLPEEAAGYSAVQRKRLAGKPGLTGLAQINGRSDMDLADIVRYDIYFNQHRSCQLYLKILFLTFPCILAGKSAY